jgi:NADP-dependent 3-hydroxy acid dehydrogenase YdfG
MSRVLITGSSTGIGRASVVELANRGHEVIATARRPEMLADLPVAQRLRLDVNNQDSVDAAIAAAGPLDAIVSNAGETVRGSVEAIPLDEYRRLMELNFIGALRVTKAVLPGFRERGAGRVIFVSSVLGRVALPMVSAYAASKFALEAVAETLAAETGHLGVRVSVLEPGPVATDGGTKAPVYENPAGYEAIEAAFAEVATTGVIQAADVARVVADTLENPDPPLRVAVGRAAQELIFALNNAPPDRPITAA